MKGLAVSHIAWQPPDDDAVASLMRRYGISGLEVTPSAVMAAGQAAKDMAAYRDRWAARGITIVAMQALFFDCPPSALFSGPTLRQAMHDQLCRAIEVAAAVGARRLVFGAPGRRRRGPLSDRRAGDIAIPFFQRIGALAAGHGVMLCIEPNPARYGCDFITRLDEGLDLVAAVASPGFGLHGDAAAITLEEANPAATLVRTAPVLAHFHASEIDLQPYGSGTVDQRKMAADLKAGGYVHWVSIEMRRPERGLPAIEAAFRQAAACYRP